MSAVMQQPSCKRRRDDYDDDDVELENWPIDKKQRYGFGSHFGLTRGLSLAPAPLSIAPTIIYPSTLTPTPSDSGDSIDSPPASAAWLSFALGGEVDMLDDAPIASSPPLHSPMPDMMFALRPSHLDPNVFNQNISGGRMPTPIYNSFSSHSLRPRHDSLFSTAAPISTPELSTPSKFPDVIQRVPSPISEDDDADTDLPTLQTESQLSRLSVEDMDGIEDASPVVSPRKGRARSGAITGKKRFFMGYRDDCDKCRTRVPGHYSHFVSA